MQYCVTLNRDERIAEDRVIHRVEYAHPLYTFASLAAQRRLPSLAAAHDCSSPARTTASGSTRTGSPRACAPPRGLGSRW